MEFLNRLLDKSGLAFAGFLGALIATRWHKDDLTDRKAWLLFLFTGMACAHYLTSMVAGYFGITDPESVAGVAFLLGTFCGSLIAAIMRAIKAADLWSLIRGRFGGGS
ncbi:MFS transporter [Pseudomonas sp. NPDC090202]|uniref:MFS transporter n=1 Tax=Pseudomonas sp. NPDC090202 TaxID=3364476 RepID=UPI00381C446D